MSLPRKVEAPTDINEKQRDLYRIVTGRVTAVCILCNLTLCLLKAFGGKLAHSDALFSDAINSGFDVISGVIVLVGAKLSQRKADENHPYGHERLENVAAILLSVILLVTAVFVGHTAIEDLTSGAYRYHPFPGWAAIVAAVISMSVKEALYWYTRAKAEQINSVSLKASAWDHRADVISTAGALAGIIAARCGFPAGDQIASLLVCVFIARTAYQVFREAIEQMTDRSCSEEETERFRAVILSVEGVLAIDRLRVRTFGNRLYVDLEIREDGSTTLKEAHDVAERVHRLLERNFPVVKHVMIHVNPGDPQETDRGE